MRIDKPWGYEQIIQQNANYVVKKLFMKNGERCSLQQHLFKLETIVVLDGILTITIDGYDKDYSNYNYVSISPNTIHRMSAKNGDVLYLECSTNHLDDVIRIEDDYQRVL